MQVEWFRSFTEAARWKSLSKAAENLNLTQPAISKHIRSSRLSYDVKAVPPHRRGRRVDSTEAGIRFSERIVAVVQSLDAIETEMRQYAHEPGYMLGSLPSVMKFVLPGRLRDYQASGYPITVKIREMSI